MCHGCAPVGCERTARSKTPLIWSKTPLIWSKTPLIWSKRPPICSYTGHWCLHCRQACSAMSLSGATLLQSAPGGQRSEKRGLREHKTHCPNNRNLWPNRASERKTDRIVSAPRPSAFRKCNFYFPGANSELAASLRKRRTFRRSREIARSK